MKTKSLPCLTPAYSYAATLKTFSKTSIFSDEAIRNISGPKCVYTLSLLFTFFIFCITDVSGAAKTFTGGAGFIFGDATKWTGGTLPVAGDDLTINGICIVDDNILTDNIAYGTLVIGGSSAGTLSWAASGTNRLNVSNTSSGFAGSSFNMTNGGTLIIRGTWASTNLAFTPGTGTIDIRSTMTLPAAYATYNNLIINGSSTTVTAGIGTSVTNFTIISGTVDLNTLTLTVTGTATYTSGIINNGSVTSSGATTTFAGTIFGAIVNATSDNLSLNGSVFNSAVILAKNGSITITSNGGNTFNSTATISNSGTANFALANTSPDIFNGPATFTNTGTAALHIAVNSVGNLFNGNVTFNNTGTGSTIRSSFGSFATATYNGNIVVNNTSTGGINFGTAGGTTTLAATKTISLGGTGFTAGTLLLRDFTQLSSTAQALTLTSSALLQIGPSAIFNGNVNFISPQLLLNGCTFNGTALLTKNGGFDNVSTGGNIFNGVTTLVCSGTASLDLGSTSPETFNSDLIINNTGTFRVQIGLSSAGNLFNGNVTINHSGTGPGVNTIIARNPGATATINGNLVLNCTNTNAGSGIIIANDGQVNINGNIIVSSTAGRGILFGAATGTVTLANGFTISDAGAGTFTTGTLSLFRFTQAGGTSQNISLAGTANLLVGSSSQFNGPVNFSAPQLFLNGCLYNNTALLTKNGATDNASSGGNIFNAATTITNSGTGFLRLANTTTDDFNSDATFIQTGSGLLRPAYAINCTVAGNLSTAGTASAITFGTTVTLDGTGAQSIAGTFSPTFNNLTISNAGNTVTSGVNSIVTGNLSVSSGTFDLGSFTADRFTTGGTLTVSNAATLRTGGTNSIPSNYAAHTIGATSTIDYSGTNQSVAVLNSSQDYGHLTISGSGTKTLAGSENVVGTLSFTGGTISTGANTIYLTSTGTVARTTGHVIGNFRKNISTGATSKIFEIGNAGNYTPVTVAFASVTTAGDLTASTVAGDHGNIGSGTINAANTANRNWTLTNSGIVFTTYGATFTFLAGDLDAGATTSNFIVGKYNAGWTYPTVGTKTATTTEATDLASFSDFQLGESSVVLPVRFTSVKATQKNEGILIIWDIAEEAGIREYWTERSVDRINFSKRGKVVSKGNNTIESYEWLDANPVAGNNYYRIRAEEADGSYFISKIVVVKIGTTRPGISVFPNPIKNGQLNLFINSEEKSQYMVVISGPGGQPIIKQVIDHPGGSLNRAIPLNKILAHGVYHLLITSNNIKYSQKIMIE